MPTGPVRYFRSSHAAGLFFESFAIEYETVKARLPRVFPFGSGAVANFTFGNESLRNGNIQFPSNAIATFCLPNASPHQPEPSLSGVSARPLLISPT